MNEKVKRAIKGGTKETDKTISPSTVYKMHVIINSSLNQAMQEGTIYRNPALLTKPPKQEKHEAKFVDKPEMNEFFKEISTDRWVTAFIFSLSTGIRRSELVALKWDMLDFEKSVVKIKKGEVRVRPEPGKTELIRKAPKSKKSIRNIPLSAGVVSILKQWKDMQNIEKKSEEYNDKNYVFAWPDGRKVSPDYWTHHFKNLADKHHLTDIHLHNLRHSFATWLLMEGESIKTVQEMLGHATAAFMLDTYGHVIPEIKRSAAEKMGSMMDDMIPQKKPQIN